MVVISVDVPKQLAKKFSSDKIVQLKDLSIEEQLLNIDGEAWNDSFVNMDIKEFLKTLKKDVINYNI
jgi:hypothetical protein